MSPVVNKLRKEFKEELNQLITLSPKKVSKRKLIKDAERKRANQFSECGIVVASCNTKEDKHEIMKCKATLKQNATYKNIYIEHDLTLEERNSIANLKNIAKVIGNDKLYVKGNRLVQKTHNEESRDAYEWQEVRHRRKTSPPQWTLSMTNFKHVDRINTSVVNGKLNKGKIIDGRQNIPEVFMNNHDMYELLKEKINLLEADRDRQKHIDNSYTEFPDILNSQMKTHLNPREINLNVNNTNHKRVNKPWWNEDLSISEKLLKAIYINKRKLFDKNVKRRKRAHWLDEQSKLLKACENTNKSDFWKDIGKIGIGSERNKSIHIEVLLADGSVSPLPQDVLNKWKNSFDKLYNVPNINNEPIDKAVKSLNKNKAPGHDGIPAEMLNNKLSVYYLHALFNVCFDTGAVPKAWEWRH
ncbi:hypothetical protein MAR_023486 [Mya arenaria]|uniref:Uncharacterized protein n=1 Tax=Mya arenaria TaxID=6604 RepID=A0ABY7DQE7_MYAAR|nr:hypothetical protein MAR_023486 [Mya arenaria]